MSASLQANASSEATSIGFLRRQRTAPKTLPAGVSASGQTAVVTGSNTGLGLAAARQLLELGLAHLVMGVRSQAKGDAVADRLRAEFPAARVTVWTVDMASYESVRAFADRCATLGRIDAVVLNAGIMSSSFSKAETTGHELMLQVNYLSTALLALLLAPVLQSSKGAAGGRAPVLNIVGSDLAYTASVRTKDPILPQFDSPKNFNQMATYSASKLLLMFFVARLAELVDPADVLINMSNPGMTKGTALGHDASLIVKKVFGIAQFFLARSPDVGASVYLDAILNRSAESHGSFISDWDIKPFPPIWYTEEGRQLGNRLWEETMKELEPAGATLPQRL